MNPVTRLNAHLSSIRCPDELAEIPGWLMWRIEHHEGEDKPRKVPYWVNGSRRSGTQGSAEDRRNLTTFAAARAAAARRGMDGVGLALLPEWGVCALDFDNCLQGAALHPEVEAIAGQSYAEWSPSGRGVRVLLKGNLLNRKSFDGDYGFETFSTRGFVTFTGNVLDICEVMGNENTLAPVTEEVLTLYRRRFAPRESAGAVGHNDEVVGLTPGQLDQALRHLDPSTGHDDWLQIGMALHHETRGDGFELWDQWSAQSDKYPGRDILRRRWDSFGRHDGPAVTGRTLLKLANAAGAGLGPNAPANADEFEALVEAKQAAGQGDKPAALRFQFQPAHAFASATALPWIIKGVLPQGGLAVVYGESGSGKSFMVLDMAIAIAQGAQWRGRKVRQGQVAYICAEGADGFRKRLAAHSKATSTALDALPLAVLGAAPNLMLLDDAVDLAAGIAALGDVSVVVVDTLAQTIPGANENAGEDMGKALGHCRRLHEMTGALVLLVHHSGKDKARGARGWSGLRAACDAELEVVRGDNGRMLRLSKSKDGVDGLEWGFDLQVVELGLDEDNDPITSCVVVEAEVPAVTLVSRKLGPVEKVVVDVVNEFAKAQTTGIEIKAVLDEAVKRMPAPVEGKRDTRRQHAKRALENLSQGDTAPFWLQDDGTLEVV